MASLPLLPFPPALLSFLQPLPSVHFLLRRARGFSTSSSTPLHSRAVNRAGWRSTIGLELHVQLRSDIKLFSRAPTSFEAIPNSNVTGFDAALPGTLPVLNPEPVKLAITAALALNCQIHRRSRFDRKHYFYPDLPAGFQITQKYSSFATNGILSLAPRHDGVLEPLDVRIAQVQMEQDTAKSMHDPHTSTTLIDLNRAGTGLIEIISEPDMHDAKQAAAYVRKVQSLLRSTRTSTADMEKGSLRIDVNVSVAKENASELGKRCEIKNLNSIRSMTDAIEYEIDRHITLLSDGGSEVEKETRGFDALEGTTYKLRSKADTPDYRYMPDPELPPLIIPKRILQNLQNALPELPDAMRDRLEREYGLKEREVDILVRLDEAEESGSEAARGLGVKYFELVAKGRDARVAANWVIHDLLGQLTKHGKTFLDNPISAQDLGRLIDSIQAGHINMTTGKALLARSISASSADNLEVLLSEAVASASATLIDYASLCESIIARLPIESEKVRKGNRKVIARLVGEGMKESKGRADANELRRTFERILLG